MGVPYLYSQINSFCVVLVQDNGKRLQLKKECCIRYKHASYSSSMETHGRSRIPIDRGPTHWFFFSFWWIILAHSDDKCSVLIRSSTPCEGILILKYDPCFCTICLFLSFAVYLFWNWHKLWSGFQKSLSGQQAWRYLSLFAFYSLPSVSFHY